MNDDAWKEVVAAAAAGDVAGATALCREYWERTSGPAGGTDETIRDFTSRLTVWEQIELWVGELDRRPHNARAWKLLGYAYMWAGLYIPALLFAAEQALWASHAHAEDEPARENLEEKVELCRRVRGGDAGAKAELASGEKAFAAPFERFPAEVPFPGAFIRMGVVTADALQVTAALVAPDLLGEEGE